MGLFETVISSERFAWITDFRAILISPSNGVLSTKIALVKKYGNYSVIVEAADSGFPSLSTNRTVPICANDFKDAPGFVQSLANVDHGGKQFFPGISRI